ncbi:MAG TPA: DUF1028 domain-containing protein [Kofleriaceae bacterium]|nr:DUF1028 domain-containing protein [Kofleriaceae bacterium]
MWRLVMSLVLLAGCKNNDSVLDPVHGSATSTPSPTTTAYCRRGMKFTRTTGVLAPAAGSNLRPANTFSIVARDPATGDLGVAVQSHWFSVGALVTWAEPGVGAVATQSFVEPAYGPKGLALMRDGMAAPDAMAKLVAADPQSAVRQLGFVDAQGRASAHTGERCIRSAGHHVGNGYTVQANLMSNDEVVPAMAKAYEAATGDLADRMLAALDAAQGVGGDIRGCQSAAILVVSGKRSDTPWAEKKLDLRVEDSGAPLVELRRLVTLARAYDHMNQGDAAVEKGDMKGAVDHYGAATTMVPDSVEMIYWYGVALANHDDMKGAMPLLQKAFAIDPAWIELTRRLPAAGLMPAPTAEAIVRDAR